MPQTAGGCFQRQEMKVDLFSHKIAGIVSGQKHTLLMLMWLDQLRRADE